VAPLELELTFNHDGRTYDLGSAYGHIALGVDDLDSTLAQLREQGVEPDREPNRVREGGSRLAFVRDPIVSFKHRFADTRGIISMVRRVCPVRVRTRVMRRHT
jgi:catechol 2,3-dioxygenase-like lactoylglutathione lyase family enzyme